jgi:hypothetical protein
VIEVLAQLFFGWPAILITLFLAGRGLVKTDYRWVVAAAILSVPYSWFLSGFPVIRSPVFLLPVLLLGSSYAMYRGRDMVAWILAIPFFLAILLLLFVLLAG